MNSFEEDMNAIYGDQKENPRSVMISSENLFRMKIDKSGFVDFSKYTYLQTMILSKNAIRSKLQKSKHVKSSDKYFIFYHHKNILHKILILLTI